MAQGTGAVRRAAGRAVADRGPLVRVGGVASRVSSDCGGAVRTSSNQRARRWGAWGLAVAAALAVAGCGASASGTASPPTTGGIASFYRPPRPLPPGPPGSLIRSERVSGVAGVPAGATVWRTLFHSTTITGTDIAESGYVVAPGGSAPPGGRPIIAWAHGTTGFAASCAPSLFTSLGSGTGPYLLPDLARYLRAGFVVAAADYQGLGVADGVHPYLLGDSEGRAVLDAARASRQLPAARASSAVVIYGHSQGGHAALFAGQMAPTYAPDLHLLGVVAAAPATGLSTLISVVGTAAGTPYLSFSIPAAYSWTQTYGDLPAADIFTPAGFRFASTYVTRGCLGTVARAIAAHHLSPAGVFLTSAETNPVVRAHAVANDPGNAPTAAPLLVLQGTADTTVPPPLTDGFVTGKACPIGDTVDYLHVAGATHGTVVFVAEPTVLQWMQGRVAGRPAPSTCGSPGDHTTLGR